MDTMWTKTIAFLMGGLMTGAALAEPPAVPATQPGNCLEDSSFEAGAFGHGWGIALGGQPSRASWASYYDSTTAFDGQWSLKIPSMVHQVGDIQRNSFSIESKFYSLTPGHNYTLSLAMKAERPCGVAVALLSQISNPAKDKRGREKVAMDEVIAQKSLKVTRDWQRFTVTTTLPQAPGNLYHIAINYKSDNDQPMNVWIDAIQLQEGDATAYAPRRPLEIGFRCPVPGHIYYDSEPATLTLAAYNPARQAAPANVSYQIVDLFDRVVDKGTIKLELNSQKNVEKSIGLFNKRRGIFRLLANIEGQDEPAELVYSVLPPNKHLDEKYEAGFLGTDTLFRADLLAILKRANFNWVMSKTICRWINSEPEKGKFVFRDDEIETAEKAKMNVMLQILWTPPSPQWALVNTPRASERGKGAIPNWPEDKKAAFLKDVGDWTYALVSHYKGKVKCYELTNEPYFHWTPEQIGWVYKAMYAAAKKADPDCICAINTDYRIYTKLLSASAADRVSYLPETVKLHGLNFCDVISAHFYNNNLDFYLPFAAALKQYGKPGWNSETGISPGTFYQTLPTVDEVEKGKNFWPQHLSNDIHRTTDIMQKNVLLTMSAGGMSRYFYYFSRFTNCSPSEPTRRGGGCKENVEFDGSLRAGGVAQSLAASFLEGCKLDSPWQKDKRIICYLFRDGSGTRGFMYAGNDDAKPAKDPVIKPLALSTPQNIPKEEAIEFFDLLTNPLTLRPKQELILTSLTTFFRSSLPPEQLAKVLDQIQVRESNLPPEKIWNKDAEENDAGPAVPARR
jgi:hypothetical protein